MINHNEDKIELVKQEIRDEYSQKIAEFWIKLGEKLINVSPESDRIKELEWQLLAKMVWYGEEGLRYMLDKIQFEKQKEHYQRRIKAIKEYKCPFSFDCLDYQEKQLRTELL
jgi:Tat protein secretion system quality control protein TatD with DNase activity